MFLMAPILKANVQVIVLFVMAQEAVALTNPFVQETAITVAIIGGFLTIVVLMKLFVN